ncbi:MAG TPA: hypothetical protein VGF79_04085, partial [Bacteroidia bacterium]
MKIKLKLNFLLLFSILFINSVYAQTSPTNEEILQDRYWTYRDRLRKYFISIGALEGQGFPFSDISSNSMSNYRVDNNGDVIPWANEVTTNGLLNVGGDVTAYMGDYMAILASEYFLLKAYHKEDTKEFKAICNEIYFAVNAIERLDKFANQFFDYTQNVDLNPDGFFVRDDAP